MICAPVVESRLPVGSSASSSGGLERQRPRDGHALLLAAGELDRIVVGPGGQADLAEQAAGRACSGEATPASSSGTATFSTAVSVGIR